MGTPVSTILIVDDDPDIREVLKVRLDALGYRLLAAGSGIECLRLIEQQHPQLVLLDVQMPDFNGIELLKELRKLENDLPVIMITAYGTIELAVQAMKDGAYDFIPKPFDLEQLRIVVTKALERETLTREVQILTEELDERHRMVTGVNAEMSRIVETARKAALSNSTILLLGESGTGKEIFARAIHSWSDRRNHPFIAINCVGLSTYLLESELFGHEKGAFTGAIELKKGKMELAHGGTVFLDEVGDISAELQTKLLRFLQEREFERVGGSKSIHVDVRIIAATNRDLEQAVKSAQFREDLFYRLDVIRLTLVPLRQRKEDIPILANYFLRKYARETKKKFVEISAEALSMLTAFNWPGNVRELANAVESSIVLAKGPVLSVDDLPSKIVDWSAELNFQAQAPTIPSLLQESHAPTQADSQDTSLAAAIERLQRDMITRALHESRGNKQKAARILGISRQGLVKMLKRYDDIAS
jgi:DNA-binding NtrC family response regulator